MHVYSRYELRSKTEKVIVLIWKILQRSALLFLWWRNKARVLFKHELLLNTQLSEPLFKIALFPQTRDLWRLCAETCSWDLDSWRCSVNNSLSLLSNVTLCGTPCITPCFWTEVLYLLRFKVWKRTPGHSILVLSAWIIVFFLKLNYESLLNIFHSPTYQYFLFHNKTGFLCSWKVPSLFRTQTLSYRNSVGEKMQLHKTEKSEQGLLLIAGLYLREA